jgi:hypothetical protein
VESGYRAERGELNLPTLDLEPKSEIIGRLLDDDLCDGMIGFGWLLKGFDRKEWLRN